MRHPENSNDNNRNGRTIGRYIYLFIAFMLMTGISFADVDPQGKVHEEKQIQTKFPLVLGTVKAITEKEIVVSNSNWWEEIKEYTFIITKDTRLTDLTKFEYLEVGARIQVEYDVKEHQNIALKIFPLLPGDYVE